MGRVLKEEKKSSIWLRRGVSNERIKKENEGLDRDGLRRRVKEVGEGSLKKKIKEKTKKQGLKREGVNGAMKRGV